MSASGSAPTVTIVTPSFNQGPFIRATIESVLAQDYPRVEYIVMDGGSTDQTAAIAAEYGSRLKWFSEKDRGQSHAINKGFQMANGEIVAWLNSDDILLPGAITRAVHAFADSPPSIGGVYGEGYLMDREGRVTGRFPATEPFNLWKLTYMIDYILQQSTFFRRAAVADAGWLDESLHYTMDWDLLIRLGKRFGLRYFPDELGMIREYPEAKSFAGGGARLEEIRRLLERHTGIVQAPGYWIYRLEGLRSHWNERLEHKSPEWLRSPATGVNFLFRVVSAVPLLWIQQNSQGLGPDRWASNRLKWMLPEGAREAVVRGHIPDDPDLQGQTLTIRMNTGSLGVWPVEPGSFDLRFTVPPGPPGPILFEVHASRYKRSALKALLQRRAWIVEAIGWA